MQTLLDILKRAGGWSPGLYLKIENAPYMSLVIEATGDAEKIEEFLEAMRSYGEMEISRSGAVAMSLDVKKLRLQPPVPTRVDMVRI